MTTALVVRVHAEYQMFGDADPTEWMTASLEDQMKEANIVGFKVDKAPYGQWGIALVVFSFDIALLPDAPVFNPDITWDALKEAAGSFASESIVFDSDPDVRWLEPLGSQEIPS